MKPCFSVLIALFLVAGNAAGQCLTNFTKLQPEPSPDYSPGFGKAIAFSDDVMAVGAPTSDSLGRISGIVYLFKKSNNAWDKIGVLKPSAPLDALQFGISIDATQNYIIVGAVGYGGKVYIFRKPASGWETMTELVVLSQSSTIQFGGGTRFNGSVDLSDDEQTLVVADEYYNVSNARGAMFVYHKNVTDEWNASITPQKIVSPDTDLLDFGTGGIAIHGDRIACATPYGGLGGGTIYIYRDVSGNFNNFQLEAKLSSADQADIIFPMGYNNFIFNDEGIFSAAVVKAGSNVKFGILHFEKPLTDIWVDSNPTCIINPIDNNTADHRSFYPYALHQMGQIFTVLIRKLTAQARL